MNAIEGSGLVVEEPNWSMLLSDPLELETAAQHWRRITTEMRDRDTLAASNGHAVQRLVIAYIVYDRAARVVAEQGPVLKPKRGNPKSIARLNPYFSAMREASAEAASAETELGLSPRRRVGVGKVEKRGMRKSPAAAYLKSVAK